MRGWARAASLPGSVSPAIRAASIARPVTPMRSEITEFELDVRILQRLLKSLDMAASLANELLAGAQQVAQNLGVGIRHEAAADQTGREDRPAKSPTAFRATFGAYAPTSVILSFTPDCRCYGAGGEGYGTFGAVQQQPTERPMS